MSEKFSGQIEIEKHIATIEESFDIGDFQRVLDVHTAFLEGHGGEEKIFEQIRLFPEPAQKQITVTLAELYDYQGQYSRVQELLKRYENAIISGEFIEWDITPRAKLQIVQYLRTHGNIEKAVRTAEKIKKQYDEQGDFLSFGDCCCCLARLHAQCHDYKAAEQYYKEGLEHFSLEAQVQTGEISPAIRWRLGIIFSSGGYARWRVGELTKASKRLHAAEGYLENTGDVVRKGTVALGIGCILRSKGDHKSALGEFEKALEYYKKVGHQLNIARALMNIGSTFLSLGSFDAMGYIQLAEERLQQALDISKQIGNIRQKAEILIRFSWLKIAHEVNNPIEGEQYAQKALSLNRRINSPLIAFDGTIALGNAYMQQGKFNEAEECFKIAFKKAQEIDADKCKLEAHLALAEYYCYSLRHLHLAIEHDNYAKEILGQIPNNYLKRKEEKIANEIENAKQKVFIIEADNEIFRNFNLKELMQQLQVWAIRIADERTNGNKTAMAKMLGLSRPGLDKLIKRLPLNIIDGN
jgi:tetratricopeptide (TPR) repeat protein